MMNNTFSPAPRVSDPYSLDNISSPPDRSVLGGMHMRLPAASSPLSSLSSKPTPNAKRQRALSEEADHARKRHIPSSPSVRAQSVTVNAKTNAADRAPTSHPAASNSASKRDSGFHEETQVADSQSTLASVPASGDGDSGFHDAVSSIGSDALSPTVSKEKRGRTPASPCPADSITVTEEYAASRTAHGPEPDDDYHDAMDLPSSAALPARDTDTIHAASLNSIVVSARQDEPPERNIVVSGAPDDEEHAIHVPPTPPKGGRAKASDKNIDQEKTPHRSTPVSRRNKAPDTAQQRIVVSGPDHDEDHIDATPQTAAKSQAHMGRDKDDNTYTVSRITAHRTVNGGQDIELLVHWEDSPDDNAPTWELEENLQENALDAVVDYWGTVEGGRAAVRPYEVYAIAGHGWLKKGKAKTKSLYLEVEWLGYKEKSTEPVRRFSQDQPELVEEYFQSIGGRPQLR